MKRAPEKRVIKQDRAVKTRSDILNSAIGLFARRGILATTMSELARAIKMTPGALYWHFPTKEDLLLAAIEELHTRFVKSFEPVMNGVRNSPASHQLAAFFDHTARYIQDDREHGMFFGMLSAESAENNDAVSAAVREALMVYVKTVFHIVKYGQKQGEYRPDFDPLTASYAIIFGSIGIMVHHNLFRETLSYVPMAQAAQQHDDFLAEYEAKHTSP